MSKRQTLVAAKREQSRRQKLVAAKREQDGATGSPGALNAAKASDKPG